MTDPTHLLTLLTSDRRGIIATITATLAESEIELLELTQTVVCGYFTITLVLALPNDPELHSSLVARLIERLGGDAVGTMVPYRPPRDRAVGLDRYILTASGEGGTSLIRSLSRLMAERGGNFIELNCQIDQRRVNVVAGIELAPDIALDQLQIDLQHLPGLGKSHVRLQHELLFKATNEIAFRRVGA